MLSQQELQQAADAALEFVEQVAGPDAIIGVGTGSTADLFIDGLACFGPHRRHGGQLGTQRRPPGGHGLKVLDLNDVRSMPIYVDGADEINAGLHMIKAAGADAREDRRLGGRALHLHRRRIQAGPDAGKFPLPLEVIPMARESVARAMTALGGQPRLREGFVTDNGNIIRTSGLFHHRRAGAGSPRQQLARRGDLRSVRAARRRRGAAGDAERHPAAGSRLMISPRLRLRGRGRQAWRAGSRTRVFGLDRQAQAQGLEHRQQRLQCGIAIGRQRAVKGLAADAGLRRDDGQATVGFGYGAQASRPAARSSGSSSDSRAALRYSTAIGDPLAVRRLPRRGEIPPLSLLMPASVSIPATTPGRP